MVIQGDIGLYLSGAQVRIKTCGIIINQPKVKDIVLFGETDFLSAVKILSDVPAYAKTIKEGKTVLENTPDFQVLLETMRVQDSELTRVLSGFFELCCPMFDIEVAKKSLNFRIKDDETKAVRGQINQINYKEFSKTLEELFLPAVPKEREYNTKSAYGKRLAEKMKRNREKLAKATGEADSNLSMFGLYTSILSVGLGMDINILYNYTPFQLYDAFKRFTVKIQYDTYRELITIPFADTSSITPADNWIDNIYKEDKEEYNSFSQFNQVIGGKK